MIRMKATNLFRYRKCIAAQVRVEQLEKLLNELEKLLGDLDEETLPYEEWAEYVHTAEKSMKSLTRILQKSYIEIEQVQED